MELDFNTNTPIFDNMNIKVEEKIFDDMIDIFCNQRGRRSDTYIAGLNKLDQMKILLKDLKKKFACNGSIKTVLYNGIDTLVVHLQGNHIAFLEKYLQTMGINNINTKVIG